MTLQHFNNLVTYFVLNKKKRRIEPEAPSKSVVMKIKFYIFILIIKVNFNYFLKFNWFNLVAKYNFFLNRVQILSLL